MQISENRERNKYNVELVILIQSLFAVLIWNII